MREEMTSRQRVLAALDHRSPDRVPFSLGFGVNAPAKAGLARRLGMTLAQTDEYLMSSVGIMGVKPDYTGPSHRNRTGPSGARTDVWGVERTPVSYGEGVYDEISHYPLADVIDISQLDRYEWPDVRWFDMDSIVGKIKAVRRDKDYAIRVGTANLFESAWYMRGFERMLMDLILNPELAWEILTRVTDYYAAYFRGILEAAGGMVDIVFTADDIGQQQGLLMSLGQWEKMIKPHHVRLNKILHEYGVKIMYHTDGAVMEAVPGLINMGIDVLEALQFDAAGMDPDILKERYGDRLCFHGGVSVQSTLPFGTPDDVRRETLERIRVLGRDGGYILAPSHAIQAGTPPENIQAFLDAARSQ